MPSPRVVLAERVPANDNFVDTDRASNARALASRFKTARTILRGLTTGCFSLLLLLLVPAIFLLGLALVGVFAAGLAVFRLMSRHIAGFVFPAYQVDRRAPG